MPNELHRLLPLLPRLADVEQGMTLDDLAQLDGRSPCHLQRVFQSAIGESP